MSDNLKEREAFESTLSKNNDVRFWNTTDAMFWAWSAALAQAQSCVPAGWKLVRVKAAEFDDLMFWMQRCNDKGHLENCLDLVDPWGKFEYEEIAASPQPQPVQPRERWHVGDSAFESWFSGYSPAGKGDKQRAREAYAAGMGELAPVAQAKPEQAAQPIMHIQV